MVIWFDMNIDVKAPLPFIIYNKYVLRVSCTREFPPPATNFLILPPAPGEILPVNTPPTKFLFLPHQKSIPPH